MTVRLDATRYALCGDAAADARIMQDLARLGAGLEAELGDALRALILVGPYARGEGSVVATDGELHAANDYPLIALHDGSLAQDAPHVLEATRQWSELLDATVRLCPFPSSVLPGLAPTLLWMDVSQGRFRLIAGVPGELQKLHAVRPSDVPQLEITRLVSDAAGGLALARLEPDPSLHKLARAVHHAVLSLGDASLLGAGRYDASLVARANVLDSGAADAWLQAAYRDAIRYIARPDLWSPPRGESWYGESLERLREVQLSMEHRRTGAPRQLERVARWGGRLFGSDEHSRRSPLRLLFSGALPDEERLYRSNLLLAYGNTEATRNAASRLLGRQTRGASGSALAHDLTELSAAVRSQRHAHPIPFGRYA